MFSALDVNIRPGDGLGIFNLGSSLWTVLDIMRTQQHTFPHVDVKYDPDSSTTPIILHIRPHLDLLFSGRHQRLHTICVRRLRDPHPPLTLRYKNAVLSSTDKELRRVSVSRAFGPTYPGNDLRYPGVWFSFDEEGLGEGFKAVANPPEDRMQEVKRVLICQTGVDGTEQDALNEVDVCSIMHGELAEAIVKVHDGVVLCFYPTSTPPVHIRLGVTTSQDLLCELGPPLRVFYKEDNRMAIHSQHRGEEKGSDSSYFYNYFQHGIDFLISGTTHAVEKIILHSNVPGTSLFQRYKRCPWQIEGRPEDDEDDSPPHMNFDERVETISHFLQPGQTPPSMHFNRTDDEDSLTLPSPTTRLLGFDGIILEATQSAQVVSVTLF
ncbi:hypothetical protein EW146_g9426 [Bondarzewia mesenterica]|uniref:Uncharacterized protein n=1 Tax=Bondarzewia mesenterica TaxID=1095465 RepID=A0A4S4L6P8_9AGAM|nr:hypothetical protein EW146_g9426 [Bondarzewia mesenterica]